MAHGFSESQRNHQYSSSFVNYIGVSQDKTVVFVGEKQSGKSSLIAKFLDEPVKEDMKETTALDFRYGTRIKDEKKQKVNIYELGKNRTD